MKITCDGYIDGIWKQMQGRIMEKINLNKNVAFELIKLLSSY